MRIDQKRQVPPQSEVQAENWFSYNQMEGDQYATVLEIAGSVIDSEIRSLLQQVFSRENALRNNTSQSE